MTFYENLSYMTAVFDSWTPCERTVVLCALFRRVPWYNFKLLKKTIETTLQQQTTAETEAVESDANDLAVISEVSKITEENEQAVDIGEKLSQLLVYLPLLEPNNDAVKEVYLNSVPDIIQFCVDNNCFLEECKHYLSYMLIHPALQTNDRRSLSHWLRYLENHLSQLASLLQEDSAPSNYGSAGSLSNGYAGSNGNLNEANQGNNGNPEGMQRINERLDDNMQEINENRYVEMQENNGNFGDDIQAINYNLNDNLEGIQRYLGNDMQGSNENLNDDIQGSNENLEGMQRINGYLVDNMQANNENLGNDIQRGNGDLEGLQLLNGYLGNNMQGSNESLSDDMQGVNGDLEGLELLNGYLVNNIQGSNERLDEDMQGINGDLDGVLLLNGYLGNNRRGSNENLGDDIQGSNESLGGDLQDNFEDVQIMNELDNEMDTTSESLHGVQSINEYLGSNMQGSNENLGESTQGSSSDLSEATQSSNSDFNEDIQSNENLAEMQESDGISSDSRRGSNSSLSDGTEGSNSGHREGTQSSNFNLGELTQGSNENLSESRQGSNDFIKEGRDCIKEGTDCINQGIDCIKEATDRIKEGTDCIKESTGNAMLAALAALPSTSANGAFRRTIGRNLEPRSDPCCSVECLEDSFSKNGTELDLSSESDSVEPLPKSTRSNSLTPPSSTDMFSSAESLYDEFFVQKPRSLSLSSEHMGTMQPLLSIMNTTGSESRLDALRANNYADHPGMATVAQWLKSLRLHKYVWLFSNISYEQMMAMDEEYLQKLGVTTGARHKLLLCISKLRARPALLDSMISELRAGAPPPTVGLLLEQLRELLVSPFPPASRLSDQLVEVLQLASGRLLDEGSSAACESGARRCALSLHCWLVERALQHPALCESHADELRQLRHRLPPAQFFSHLSDVPFAKRTHKTKWRPQGGLARRASAAPGGAWGAGGARGYKTPPYPRNRSADRSSTPLGLGDINSRLESLCLQMTEKAMNE